MLAKTVAVLCLLSLCFALPAGRLPAVGQAVMDGASRAVTVTLSLCGMLCLWGGLMEVFREAGAVKRLARLLRPLLVRLFPTAAARGEGLEEITANISANLLGMGNAATPLALAAMEKLQKSNPTPDRATDDMVMLTVLNCSSLSLLPTTLLALRHSAGSHMGGALLLPIWAVSAFCTLLGATLTRICCKWKP